jgi:hypothetical protein
MKLVNLDTYLFIIEHMDEESAECLCRAHGDERISISVLKYLIERRRIMKSCNGKKAISRIADENGVSKGKVYRIIKKKENKVPHMA